MDTLAPPRYIPWSSLGKPGPAIVSLISGFVGLGCFSMMVILSTQMIIGNRIRIGLKLPLIILNMCACMLQFLEFFYLYEFPPHGRGVPYIFIPFMVTLMMGGVFWMQLEIRFVFSAMFDTGSNAIAIWTPNSKLWARVLLILIHIFLCWPAYYLRPNIAWINWWYFIGPATQAYRRKSESEYYPLRRIHMALMFLLIATFIVNLGGIAGFSLELFLGQDTRIEMQQIVALGFQIPVVSLGMEIMCESITLLIMIHLVTIKRVLNAAPRHEETAAPEANSLHSRPMPVIVMPSFMAGPLHSDSTEIGGEPYDMWSKPAHANVLSSWD
ncbi:hypothetical protein BDV3_005102 [Batrachochytrium dendrobatidis]